MNKLQESVALAAYRDAKQTWPSVTREFIFEQAERVLAGKRPKGGPGMMVADAFLRAGFISTIPNKED